MQDKSKKPHNDAGERHGYWEWYRVDGTLMYKGEYKNDMSHGYWVWYHDNGHLWNKGTFINNRRHGYWEWCYKNGNIRRQRFYAR